jgi:hypothetical protein
MRSRWRWALPALLAGLCAAPALRAADDVKEPEGKYEKDSPSLWIDYEILSDVPEVEPNDTPGQATPLVCGSVLRPAQIAVQAVRDTDWIVFTANSGDVIIFGTDADGPTPVGDTRISLVSNDGVTVLGTNDDRGLGNHYSLLSLCAPYTGTYYGRIAAFSSQTGTYMAFLTCSASSAPNDQCAGAIRIPCGPFSLSGSTASACPDYALPGSGCTGFLANGRDVVYKVESFAGDSISLDYVQDEADASIYIVTDCSDPAGTCVAGEDSTLVGGHETLAYRFTTPGTYYIILDSFSPGSGGPWTLSGVLTCAPDRIDALAATHADINLTGPWGTETIALNGPASLTSTVHALGIDFSGAESIPTELTELELTGNSLNAGPVTLRLRPATSPPFQRSSGRISETLNLTPGVLDLPPFAPGGSATMQLNTWIEVEIPVLKLLLHNTSTVNLYGLIHAMPAGASDSLSNLFAVPLVDEGGSPSGYSMGSVHLVPNPAVALDSLVDSRMTLDLQGPLGLDTVTLKGTGAAQAKLGNLGDTDGNGLEQVETSLRNLSLSGVSLRYGPVHVSMSLPAPHALPPTDGEIEENVNAQTARLDLPPFAGSGTASSFLDLLFTIEIGGAVYHNHVPKHLFATLTQVPPAPGDQYRNFVPTPLLNGTDAASPYTARRMFFTPYDVQPTGTQLDSLPGSRLVADVSGPWGFDQLVLVGTPHVATFLGTLADTDDDQLEQVGTHLTDMHMVSSGGALGHMPGPVILQLSDSLAFGDLEELVNYTPGLLDLPPFTPVGSGSGSFSNVRFEVSMPGYPLLHTAQPAHLAGTVTRVPAGAGDLYREDNPIPLLDPSDQPSGLVITALRLTTEIGYSTVGAPEPPALPAALAIQEVRPNPTSGSATLTLALPRRASARLAAYDVNGRLVRTLWDGAMDAGVRTVTWDGRTDHGTRAPGGVYFLRFESANQRAVRRLAIVR